MTQQNGIRELGMRRDSKGRIAVYAVRVAQGEVFMKVEDTPYMNHERAVVHVDAERFMRLWQKDPSPVHHEWAFGNEASWRADRKFPKAVEGFSYGELNPVPLANVFCESVAMNSERSFLQKLFGQPPSMYVGVTNGITRTIWLLSHGCKAFPVECNIAGALALHQLAGASATLPKTVEELTNG